MSAEEGDPTGGGAVMPAHGAGETSDDLIEAMGWIRRSAAAVDRLWSELRVSGAASLGMALGEASQALHRALMALSDQSPARLAPAPFSPDGASSIPAPAPWDALGEDLAPELAAAVVELCPDGIVIIGPDGTIRFANPAAETIFGHAPRSMAGMTVEELVPERFRDAHVGHRLAYSDTPAPRPMGVGLELWALRADGEEVPVQISLSPASVAGRLHTIAMVRDVSVHRASESAARVALLSAEEDRIAADLHNRVIDGLFRAGLGIQSVIRLADGPVAARLTEAVGQIDEVIRAIRAAVFDLAPEPGGSASGSSR